MAETPSTGFDVKGTFDRLIKGDVLLAAGIAGVIVLMILPLPGFMLDMFLAISILISVLILMTVLFMKRALEFSAFPAVLLIATLYRLALNIATTRLILSHGHEGTGSAGKIIETFGHLMMQGNFVIGVIVFAILILVNFVVITKGSGRIAEVAARFTLDSMPGKQMAIDADLSSGLIDEDEAKRRRKELEGESNFFGAMDGASKFVRGDAVAGLVITAVNVIGGIIIGVAQEGMPLIDAAHSYTTLTIGDGLVSQIPALIISIAAGLMVSKAGLDEAADTALARQLGGNPMVLGIVSVSATGIGLIPGMPLIPFALLAMGSGFLAYRLSQKIKLDAAKPVDSFADTGPVQPIEETTADMLAIDDIRIELGFNLMPLLNDVDGRKLTDQIKALRKQLAQDMGVIMPTVRVLDNLRNPADQYTIRIKEMDVGMGEIRYGMMLAMSDAGSGEIDLPGERTREPAFGLPAVWIDNSLREEATFRGYTVVDAPTVLVTHMTEIVKDYMPELLSYAEVQKLLKDLPKDHQKLVEDLIPNQISTSGVHRVLQALLRERVSIRDLPTILEGIAEAVASTQNAAFIVEHVRTKLARQLCHAQKSMDGMLPILMLSPDWEQTFAEALIGQGEEKQLALAPTSLQGFINDVRNAYNQAAQMMESPVLLTSPAIRPYVRSLVERFRPQTVVMSQNEVHPKMRLKTLGQV
jgi:flagellar biosynthesis protein FlhA